MLLTSITDTNAGSVTKHRLVGEISPEQNLFVFSISCIQFVCLLGLLFFVLLFLAQSWRGNQKEIQMMT